MITKGDRSIVLALIIALAILTASTSNAVSQNADPQDFGGGVVFTSSAAAPQPMLAPDPPVVGSGVIHFGAEAFKAYSQNATWTRNNTLMLYATGAGNQSFDAPVVLPNGVTVKQVVFYYYDYDLNADAEFAWITTASNSMSGSTYPYAYTFGSSSEMRYMVLTDFPDVIDNASNNYFVRVSLPGGAPVGFKSVRIEYSYDTALPAISR